MNTTVIRTPDMHDTVTGTVAWIGQDVTVEVASTLAGQMDKIADFATQYARDGIKPQDLGISVTSYGIPFTHVIHTASGDSHRKTAPAAFVSLDSLWRGIREALGWHEIEEIDLRPNLIAKLDLDAMVTTTVTSPSEVHA